MRIRVRIQQRKLVQYISVYQYYPLNFFDLSAEKDNQKSFKLQKELSEKPFELVDSDLFYGAYIKTATETTLFFKQHHLITDAWSVILTGNRILNYYLQLRNNEDIDEIIQEPSFVDYLEVEKNYLNSKRFLTNKLFWQIKTENIPEFINIKNKPIKYSTRAQRAHFLIPNEIFSKMNRFCQQNKFSILVLFVAVYSVYINRSTSNNYISFGTTILNRTNYKEKNTLGMFVNMIPILLYINKDLSFGKYVNYVASNWKDFLYNSHYPYDLIIENYRKKHETTDSLFDVSITYQNAVHHYPDGFQTIKSYWHPCSYQTNSLNIHLNHRENVNQCEIDYDYLIDLFTEAEIESLHQRLLHILANALDNPAKPVSDLEIMTDEEKRRVLWTFNQTEVALPRLALHQLVERQAIQHPRRIALIFEERRLTYRDLNQQADRLANILRHKGVAPEAIVGLLARRSPEMIIGMLAILKAGAAYLPLDNSAPRQRIEYMLRDSGSELLLTHYFLADLSSWHGEIVTFERREPEQDGDLGLPDAITAPGDLAYVIYTSGSTGQPKGVMIEHRAIVNTVHWRKNYYHFTADDVLLQIPPCNFDSSVEDIFSFLSAGAAIVLVDEERRLDLIYLQDLIRQHRVSHFLATPLLYQAMLDEIGPGLQGLASVTVAGENFHLNLVKRHFRVLPGVKLYNEYGPTENSVCSTVYQFSPGDEAVVMGRPINNCQCYVLNPDGQPQPVDVPGELYLGGAGLARGYVNNSTLTQEKFKFFPQLNQRLYKTGDLVKWTSGGQLQFIERVDHQVKLRGFRIELGEIEFHLLNHPAIREAIVVAGEEGSHQYLCAYLIAKGPFDPGEVKVFLSKYLPEYMIPAHYVPLVKFPLTPNGKIDRQALPKPEIGATDDYRPPQNEVEARLVTLWQEVLKVSPIGTQANPFQLGGDSLGVIRILAASYADNWGITVQDFYKYPTIKELADYILSSRSQTHHGKEIFPDPAQDVSGRPRKDFKPKAMPVVNPVTKRSFNQLLLTGASGFLGIHLLLELLRQNEIKITALVREQDSVAATTRLWQLARFYFPQIDLEAFQKRVTVISGDIGEERLGLPETDYRLLYERIDTVLHGAALVKHYGHFRDFQRINVDGVRRILQFCENKYLMHVSTTSIAGDYAPQSRADLYFDETCLDIGQNLANNAYVQSKLEAEKLIDREIHAGLKGTVIRVGNLTGRYNDGVFQHNIQENKFYQVLKAFIHLAAVPASLTGMMLEFTPVDLCTQAIVRLLQIDSRDGRRFHLYNPHRLTLGRLAVTLSELGFPIRRVSDGRFRELLQKVLRIQDGFENLQGIIPDLAGGELRYGADVILGCQISLAVLKQLDFTWPQVDHVYLEKILSHMQARGFIQSGGEEPRECFKN